MNLKKLHLAAALGLTLLAAPTFAETAATPTPDAPRVEYRNYGQGSYAVAVPRTGDAPYALTGDRDLRRSSDYWNRQTLRYVEVGQGRWLIPVGQ